MGYLRFDRMLSTEQKYEDFSGAPPIKAGSMVYVITDQIAYQCMCLGFQIVDGVMRLMIHSPKYISVNGEQVNIFAVETDTPQWHDPGEWHIHLGDGSIPSLVGEMNWK